MPIGMIVLSAIAGVTTLFSLIVVLDPPTEKSDIPFMTQLSFWVGGVIGTMAGASAAANAFSPGFIPLAGPVGVLVVAAVIYAIYHIVCLFIRITAPLASGWDHFCVRLINHGRRKKDMSEIKSTDT